MEDAKDAGTATIVVIADESNGSITGVQASPELGECSEYVKKAASKSTEDLRHTKGRLKSNQEPAVVGTLRYIKETRRDEAMTR